MTHRVYPPFPHSFSNVTRWPDLQVRDLREFGLRLSDADTQDCLSVFNEAVAWLNAGARRVLVVPPPDAGYRLTDSIDDLTQDEIAVVTYGAEVTHLNVEAGASARVWNLNGGNKQHLGGFLYNYTEAPANADCAVRFGDTADSVVEDSRIIGGAGCIEFSSDGSRNFMKDFRGNVDWSVGGWAIKNLGSSGCRCNEVSLNATNGSDSGAGAGGGMLLIKPDADTTSDGCQYRFGAMQGPNTEGPDYGCFIDTSNDAKNINNQKIVGMTFDHCYRYEFKLYAPPGSNARSRKIEFFAGGRMSGDGPSLYVVDWQSTKPCVDLLLEDMRMGFRANERPVWISSAPNTLSFQCRGLRWTDGSNSSVAQGKTVMSIGAGYWEVSNCWFETGSAGSVNSHITRGAEFWPYETRAVIVDANAGTWTISKAGGGTSAAMDPDVAAATLESELQTLYGNTDVHVFGGPGGIFGPLRTRLAADFSVSPLDSTITVVDSSNLPSSGQVRIASRAKVSYTTNVANVLGGLTLDDDGGETSFLSGSTVSVVNSADDDEDSDLQGLGAVYYIYFDGATYSPDDTTAPGWDGSAHDPGTEIDALTVDGSSLTGSGEVGGGLGVALIDTVAHAVPLENLTAYRWNGNTVQTDTPTEPQLKHFSNATMTTAGRGTAIGESIILSKPDDEVVTDDTFQDDDDLKLWLGPNSIWHLKLLLQLTGVSTAADFKIALTKPGGASHLWGARSNLGGVGTGSSPNALDTGTITFGLDANTSGLVIEGWVYNGATEGLCVPKWAQNTLTAENVTLEAGSLMICNRIA